LSDWSYYFSQKGVNGTKKIKDIEIISLEPQLIASNSLFKIHNETKKGQQASKSLAGLR